MREPCMPVKAKTQEHETPDDLLNMLNKQFMFTLDAAASGKVVL